jgi:hypothetical protein
MGAAWTRTKKRSLEGEGQTRLVGRDRRRLLSEIVEKQLDTATGRRDWRAA